MPRLSWKFIGAFILVVVVSVFLMAFLISQSTTHEFRQYITRCDMEYVQDISSELTQFYSKAHSWNGVQSLLNGQLRSRGDRLVLVDNQGKVVGDTANEWHGKNAKDIGLYNAISVSYSGQNVAEFYLISTGSGNSYCSMEGRGCGPMGSMNVQEQNFLNSINNYLWLAGAIAAIVALFLGVLLTRQIILPVRDLTRGARQIAGGNLGYRVKENSKDELGELAESFNSMASNLDKLEQARRRLTADITHELRTPLTVIEGTVDAIMDGVFQPDKEHLGTIKEQTSQLTKLVNDLRDISSAESGQMKLNIVSTDIGELIKRKIAQMEIKALNKGVNIKTVVPENLPAIEVDPNRLEQVLTNLLINAIRHTPSGGHITVSAELSDKSSIKDAAGKRGLVISVADTGEGIPADHLHYIFERFYRVDNSRYKNEGEVGLGLAIVKQMVLAHGGEVWAESTEGKGSTFYIRLPLQ